jgi:Fur family peroxide stress response transcriptional regulator
MLLYQTPRHCTVEELYELLRQTTPAISLATLYNTMKAFVDAGIAQELPFGDGPSRYDVNTEPHHHLVCDECGEMIDITLPDPALTSAAQAHDFHIRSFHIEVRGVCAACAAKRERETFKR